MLLILRNPQSWLDHGSSYIFLKFWQLCSKFCLLVGFPHRDNIDNLTPGITVYPQLESFSFLFPELSFHAQLQSDWTKSDHVIHSQTRSEEEIMLGSLYQSEAALGVKLGSIRIKIHAWRIFGSVWKREIYSPLLSKSLTIWTVGSSLDQSWLVHFDNLNTRHRIK